jgi:acyl carrier protein
MTSPSIDTDLESKVKDIVTDILEIDPDEMTPTSRFKEDHDADSLLAIEILASLEKTFKITIAQEELVRMVNLEGVCAVVAEAAAERQ